MRPTRPPRPPAAAPARSTALAKLGHVAMLAARDEGIDVAGVLSEAGLPGLPLDALDARLDAATLMRLWSRLAEASADPFFGLHAGERFASASTYAIVGFAARQCATLGEAMLLVCRYSAVINDGTVHEVIPRGATTVIRAHSRPGAPRWPRPYAEFIFATYITLARRWTGRDLQVSASFSFEVPRSLGEYRRLFGRDLRFAAVYDELRFPSEALRLPLAEHDAELRRYLEAQATHLQQVLGVDGPTTQRARRAMQGGEGAGRADLATIATELGMSARTLQRHLEREGHSFADLCDEVRRERVLGRIEDPTLSIKEVAAHGGFSSMKAFRAAFLRWTGLTPRAYRARVR